MAQKNTARCAANLASAFGISCLYKAKGDGDGMRVCSVGTSKYEADIGKLLQRRIKRLKSGLEPSCGRSRAVCEVSGCVQLDEWCTAVAELMLHDLAQFEIAYMVNELPVSLEEKKAVLPEAIRLAREALSIAPVQEALVEYFSQKEHLELEGFITFRMQEHIRAWRRSVVRAADEMLLDAEYMELMQVLAAFVQLRAPALREVYVILNPDGSCTFTDDRDVRIDYERCTGDGIMSVLVGLAPERITVYDLSGGRSSALAQNLMRIFDGRVRFFK